MRRWLLLLPTQQMVQESQDRVTALLGATRSEPILGCLTEPSVGLDIHYGTTRFAPGLPAVVVLGPKGTNVDVMAHEWAHAELAVRTSALLRTYRIPTWFDEGLAMQLDRRPAYSRASLNQHIVTGVLDGVGLLSLNSPSEFFQPGKTGRAHYALAKCVVAQWLLHPDTDLLQVIDGVSWSKPLDADVFVEFEAACRESTLSESAANLFVPQPYPL